MRASGGVTTVSERCILSTKTLSSSATKAKDAVSSIIKRLAHKNVNVVLYSLTLANALVQNCSINLKAEVASRPFLGTLQKLLSNPKTHPAVKNRVLDLVQSWAESFRGESQLDFMVETYRQLASEGMYVIMKAEEQMK